MDEASAGELCRAFDLRHVRCWVVGGWGVDALPTAYVMQDQSGRHMDVHVLDDRPLEMTPLRSTDRRFIPGALDASGTIDGVGVRCMSARMQLVAHEGYELPSEHQADVVLLQQLIYCDLG